MCIKNLSEQELMLLAVVLNVTQTYINHVALGFITPTPEMNLRITRAVSEL